MLSCVRRVAAAALVADCAAGISRPRFCRASCDGRAEGVHAGVEYRCGSVCVVSRSIVRSTVAAGCLTRVVIDNDRSIEIAQLQTVMQRIQSMLDHVPAAQREYIANALLNLAVERIGRVPRPARADVSSQTVAITCSLRPDVS